MSVIYLRHPLHGEKVATLEEEAQMDRANGWQDFDPKEVTPQQSEDAPKPARRGRPRKVQP